MNKATDRRFAGYEIEALIGRGGMAVVYRAFDRDLRRRVAMKVALREVDDADEPLLVHGEVRINQRDEEHPQAEIVATDIELLSQVRNQKTTEVALRIDADRLRPETVGQLRALLGRHPGACAVTVRAVIPERSETRMKTKERVSPSDDFIEAARRLGFEVELR